MADQSAKERFEEFSRTIGELAIGAGYLGASVSVYRLEDAGAGLTTLQISTTTQHAAHVPADVQAMALNGAIERLTKYRDEINANGGIRPSRFDA